MGGAQAKAEVDSAISVATSILNTASQACTSAASNSVIFTGKNCQTIIFKDIDINQTSNINVTCVQTNTTTADIKNSVDQTISQMAKAVTQALSLNPAGTYASTITKLSTALSNNIINAYSQACTSSQSNSLIFAADCKDPNPASAAKFIGIRGTQGINSLAQCTQTNSSVVSVANQIKQQIDQAVIAQQESLFGPLLALLLIVLIIIIAFAVGGVKIFTNRYVIALLIVILIIYMIVAFIRKWFPFAPLKKKEV